MNEQVEKIKGLKAQSRELLDKISGELTTICELWTKIDECRDKGQEKALRKQLERTYRSRLASIGQHTSLMAQISRAEKKLIKELTE